MQCIDRCVEISVFLLQPGELGFELTLIFSGHVCGGRKPIGVNLGCGCPEEIIVLAQRDRTRSAVLARGAPATDFLQAAAALRMRIDIMEFSRAVPF